MATNKIQNLKITNDLHKRMFDIYQSRFSDCNRGFTGDIFKDVEIQKANIEESRVLFNRQQEIVERLTKAAFKGGDEFDEAVQDAQEFIKELQA